jgi:malate permease and related proteins
MSQLVLLMLCFIAGILLRKSKRMPVNTPAVLNTFILHISVPALTLRYLHDIQFEQSMWLVVGMAWLHFTLAAVFFVYVGRWMNLPRSTVGALMLTGGMANTAFFGLPMVEAYYGQAGIPTAILIDQLGSFLVLSILGVTVAGLYSTGRPSAKTIVLRVLTFPPFIALCAALLLIPIEFPVWLIEVLKRLGDTLAPLALVSVGFQLRLGHLAGNQRNLALGLAFKLILAPLAIYVLYVQLLGGQGQTMQITVFESAMPPMITAAILATEHDLDPPLATLMVAIGILVSFVTLTGWWWALRLV